VHIDGGKAGAGAKCLQGGHEAICAAKLIRVDKVRDQAAGSGVHDVEEEHCKEEKHEIQRRSSLGLLVHAAGPQGNQRGDFDNGSGGEDWASATEFASPAVGEDASGRATELREASDANVASEGEVVGAGSAKKANGLAGEDGDGEAGEPEAIAEHERVDPDQAHRREHRPPARIDARKRVATS